MTDFSSNKPKDGALALAGVLAAAVIWDEPEDSREERPDQSWTLEPDSDDVVYHVWDKDGYTRIPPEPNGP